jgi:hypothetical protein
MAKSKKAVKMTRREKLYLRIIGAFAHTNTWYGDRSGISVRTSYAVHCTHDGIAIGDVVMAQTSMVMNPNPFVIGKVHEIPANDLGTWVIEDIFTGTLCNYSNETFIKIHNLPYYLTMNDRDHRLYRRFVVACKKVDSWKLRCCDAKPTKDGMIFTTRQRYAEGNRTHKIKRSMKSAEICEQLQKELDEEKDDA